MGFTVTTTPITYTAVGASSPSTLPTGSFMVYGGQNELPGDPNNGSSTFVSPLSDTWASTDGVSWVLIGGYSLPYGMLAARQFQPRRGMVHDVAAFLLLRSVSARIENNGLCVQQCRAAARDAQLGRYVQSVAPVPQRTPRCAALRAEATVWRQPSL